MKFVGHGSSQLTLALSNKIMTTEKLATEIYKHVTELRRGGYHWDEWDDKREIQCIKNMIETFHRLEGFSTNSAGFQGSNETDGLSGFRG